MSTITKERLQRLIRAIDSESYDEEEIVGWVNSNEIMELARIALTSLEAEPVAMRWRYLPDGIHGMGEWNYRDQGYIDTLNAYHLSRQKELLYTAPPASVSVPDLKGLDEFIFNLVSAMASEELSHNEKELFSIASKYISYARERFSPAMLQGGKS